MSKSSPYRATGAPREDLEQQVFVQWCRLNWHLWPGLSDIHSIANELPYTGKLKVGHRIALYKKLANMGMVKGAPDLFIPAIIYPKHGIYVEMKAKDGELNDHQIIIHMKLKRRGYDVIIGFGFESAKRQLLEIIDRGKRYEQCRTTV